MKSILLPFLALLACSTVGAQDLKIVVKAGGAPSRDAHFNWKLESAGGGNVQIGQFACGSYWVAPAAGDSAIRVLSLTGNPDWNDSVSCDADPITESHGLLDGSNNYGSYNANENIVPKLPMEFEPAAGSAISLVAAMQRNEAETSHGGTPSIEGEVVDAYCIVTVLPEAPADGGSDMIRPNITGTTKEFLTWDDFDLSRLPTYDFLEGYTAEEWEATRRRWSHSTEIFGMLTEHTPGNFIKYSEGGRAFRAAILISDYGAGAAASYNNDVLSLFSAQNTLEEKKAALAAMIAYGLDIYHNRYNYGDGKRKAWSSGAGQSLGTFVPPVLAASLLRDDSKSNVLKKVAITNHDPDQALRGPHELRQQTRGVTGVLLWGDDTPFIRNGNTMTIDERAYWGRLLLSFCFDGAIFNCNEAGGSKTGADPYGYIDGPPNRAGAFYMNTASGGIRGIASIMVLMPAFRATVNTDDPIEYADRITRHGVWTAPDPVAIPSIEAQELKCNSYRDNCPGFGVTWGARPDDVRYAIEDGSGRFVSQNGRKVNISFEASRTTRHWDKIIAMYDGETFEDNAVPLGTVAPPSIIFEFGEAPKAHIKSSNYDTTIYYTVDGSNPTRESNVYQGPFDIVDGTEVRAFAVHADMTDSPLKVRVFDANPDFSQPEPEPEPEPEPPTEWGGQPVEDGYVDSLSRLGWLYLLDADWAWSYGINRWIFSPDPGADATGIWFFLPR